MELIKNFQSINKNDVIIAGGKGASLGEMTQVGISVPPGFVILSVAFEKFLEETDLNVEIEAILDSVNHKEMHTVENASEKIKSLILQLEIPRDISVEIQKFFKNLNSKYVAVRSSATAEDSASAAWAGQLESYLNTTEENLLENVKKCWASLFTPRAIFYRFEKDLHKQKISVAVVVQKMVESEKSGIAFSVHPVTQDKNQLIIEAGFGLGETIVSGQITPDSYVIEKQPRRIIDKNIQTQARGLYRVESGGNEWHDIPKEQGNKEVLSDKEILELSEIILKIENHYDFPCDIEWAFEKRKFYIVQSRPITTLGKMTDDPIFAENKLFGIFPTIETYKENSKVFDLYKDYIFANKKWYPKGIKAHLLLMLPQGIAAAAGVSSVHPVGFKIGIATYENQYMSWSYDPRDFFAIGQDVVEQNRKNTKWAEEYKKSFWEETKSFKQKIDDIYWNFNSENKSEIKNIFLNIVNNAIKVQSYGYITEIFTLTDDYWVTQYIKNLEPKFTDEEISTLLHPTSMSFVKEYQKELSCADSNIKLDNILKKYFWVKGSYFTLPVLTIKSLAEEQESLKYEEQEIPDKTHILTKAKNRKELERFISTVEMFIAIQDERKANVLRLNYVIQKLCQLALSSVKGLAETDLLSLAPSEFIKLLEGTLDTKASKDKIEPRNARSVWLCTNEGYFLTYDTNQVREYWNIFDEKKDDSVVRGYKASSGKVSGTVKIVFSENDFYKIKRGDILVTSMTRPEFLPILEKAAAFVTNEGGITCHAAIVSREMKKPCIIGTKNATKILKDGDLVEVDANNGLVRILE